MGFRNRDVEERVVYVERGGSGFGWFVIGAALGAGLALLYAPRSGEETRRELGRRWDDLKDEAEEKLEELSETLQEGKERVRTRLERLVDGDRDAGREDGPPPSAREELERRLSEARARRRRSDLEEEEPVA